MLNKMVIVKSDFCKEKIYNIDKTDDKINNNTL
jgi:hypothetical protein